MTMATDINVGTESERGMFLVIKEKLQDVLFDSIKHGFQNLSE